MKFCSAYLWEKGKKEEYNPVSLVLQQVEVRKQAVLFACVCRGEMESYGEQERCGELELCEDVEGEVVGRRSDLEMECSGYFTEALVEWFHRECLELLERKWSEAELEKRLQREVKVTLRELGKYAEKRAGRIRVSFVGMLLVEQRFWMFSQGKMQAFLLNRRYNRKHMRRIVGEDAAVRLEGMVVGGVQDARLEGMVVGGVQDVRQEGMVAGGGQDVRLEGVIKENESVTWQTEPEVVCFESGAVQKKLGILLCTQRFLQGMQEAEVAEVLLAEGVFSEERFEKRLRELRERQDDGESVGAVLFRTY